MPYIFIEADGAIEGLDVLRLCYDGASSSGLSVFDHSLADFGDGEALASLAFRGDIPTPVACGLCAEVATCAGGYLPHRYRPNPSIPVTQRFDNPSVWCADIQRLFAIVREILGVDHDETAMRAEALRSMAGVQVQT